MPGAMSRGPEGDKWALKGQRVRSQHSTARPQRQAATAALTYRRRLLLRVGPGAGGMGRVLAGEWIWGLGEWRSLDLRGLWGLWLLLLLQDPHSHPSLPWTCKRSSLDLRLPIVPPPLCLRPDFHHRVCLGLVSVSLPGSPHFALSPSHLSLSLSPYPLPLPFPSLSLNTVDARLTGTPETSKLCQLLEILLIV